MRYLLLLTLYLITSLKTNAQDLIVTPEGDSLNCKITGIKGDYIYLTYMRNKEKRNTLFKTASVKSYQYSFYKTSEVPTEKSKQKSIYAPKSPFRLAFNLGPAWRVGKIEDGLNSQARDYLKELMSGRYIDVKGTYFFSNSGIGLTYNRYSSKHSVKNANFTFQNGGSVFGNISDEISIIYIAPTVAYRSTNQNVDVVWDFSVGYMGYTNKSTISSSSLSIEGSTIGLSSSLNFDIPIHENFKIGFQLSFLSGSLSKLTAKNGSLTSTVKLNREDYENLSQLNLGIGFRLCQ